MSDQPRRVNVWVKDVRHKLSKVNKPVKGAALVALAALIFLFGVGVGNGRIAFGTTTEGVNKDLPTKLDYSSVDQVYNLLKANYDGKLDANALLDGVKSGLAKATGDPYTVYFSPKDAKAFNDQLSGSFTGIGAELGQDDKGNLIVVSPISGFPAQKAGLRAQDMILNINGTSTSGMSIDDAVNRIRGPKGTQVSLHVLRNKTDDMNITITRDDIKIPSVKWSELDGNVGYIQVSQFSDDTTDLMHQAANELKAKGVTSILLDLRGNPGGLLQAAVDMGNMWIPEGKTIVQEKRGGVVTNTYTSGGAGAFLGMKTAVLIDSGSASAAEIVSGALRDNNVATLFGQKSYGKGSVQEIQNLPNGSELKVTVARWYRPNGQNIDKKGITPDHVVQMTDSDYKQGTDPQKDAALNFLRGQ